mmetsp:Transcript_7628/g.19863  ORF Transcript_7628/g.19863 Transcript_7628/m.19863 type:complete len:457 (-) Transcript_7628:348-1718(-)
MRNEEVAVAQSLRHQRRVRRPTRPETSEHGESAPGAENSERGPDGSTTQPGDSQRGSGEPDESTTHTPLGNDAPRDEDNRRGVCDQDLVRCPRRCTINTPRFKHLEQCPQRCARRAMSDGDATGCMKMPRGGDDAASKSQTPCMEMPGDDDDVPSKSEIPTAKPTPLDDDATGKVDGLPYIELILGVSEEGTPEKLEKFEIDIGDNFFASWYKVLPIAESEVDDEERILRQKAWYSMQPKFEDLLWWRFMAFVYGISVACQIAVFYLWFLVVFSSTLFDFGDNHPMRAMRALRVLTLVILGLNPIVHLYSEAPYAMGYLVQSLLFWKCAVTLVVAMQLGFVTSVILLDEALARLMSDSNWETRERRIIVTAVLLTGCYKVTVDACATLREYTCLAATFQNLAKISRVCSCKPWEAMPKLSKMCSYVVRLAAQLLVLGFPACFMWILTMQLAWSVGK